MSDFVEYKPMDVEHNVKAAVENLRKAYWSNDTEKVAMAFTEARSIIVSAICHDNYNVCKPDDERPKGDYVDISKLRLMTVEECAGHTIDYAMGWKACIEWIKKGGKGK